MNKKYTGKATYTFPDGKVYTGDFVNGIPEGFGTMTFNNYDEYEGQWTAGEMDGHGTYRFYDEVSDRCKNKYEGCFKNSQFHGLGKMSYNDRTFYCGEWVLGLRDGFGKLWYPSGDMLYGKWHKDEIVEGTYEFADGSKYIGNFQHFKFFGFGVLVLSDGTVKHGIWENHKLINGAEFLSDGTIYIIGNPK